MAIPAWKRFEKGPWMQRNKTRLRQWLGRELVVRPSVTLPTVIDADWCYDASRLSADSVVYSLGVGDSIEFDLALIERTGASLHAFDPTPASYATLAAATLPDRFQFHPWAVAGQDGTLTLYPRLKKHGVVSDTMFTLVAEEGSRADAIDVPMVTVQTIMSRLGHRHVDLLKMDIEGAEYDVVDSILASPHRPAQLLIEFHHRHAGIGREKTLATISKLEAAGYRIFYVSDNVREISFVHGD